MKKRYTILVLLCCIVIFKIHSEDYIFNFSISDFQIEYAADGAAVYPINENFVLLEDTSMPALPVCYKNILLPPNATISSYDYFILEQSIMPNIHYLRKNTYPLPTDNSAQTFNTILEHKRSHVYSFANHVSILSESQYGNYRYITLQICPFTYYADSCLILLSQIKVSINTNELYGQPTNGNNHVNIDIFRKILLNSELMPHEVTYRSHQQVIDYIIITPDSLKSAYLPLKWWKTIKGINTKIITTEEIYSTYAESSPQLKIKRCLYDYYNSYGTKWVLLGGDNTIVPVVECYGKCGQYSDKTIPCDLFYACFEGQFDWNANGNDTIGEIQDNISMIPNVFVSRLPIRTKDHVSNYIQKLLKYEQNPPSQNYAKKFLMCGKHLWNTYANGISDGQLKSELFYTTYIQPYWNGIKYRFYDSDTDFGGNYYDLTPENIIAQFNTGYQFVHYAAHGQFNYWTTETNNLTPSYVTQLDNSNYYPVIVTMSCLTNKFDSSVDPCLSEAFIRDSKGAICYLGSSRYGWGYINSDSSHIYLGPSFNYNGIFLRSIFRDKALHFAESTTYAKLAYVSSSYNYGAYRWLQFSLNPIGDPEIPIYTENPLRFMNVTLTKTNSDIFVNTNGVDSCTITITSADDYGETYFNTIHDVSSAIFEDIPSSYYIAITKRNFTPYIYSSPLYIQNEILNEECIITNTNNIAVGESVTPIKPTGKVIIPSTGKLEILNADNVSIESGFEVELGGALEIR